MSNKQGAVSSKREAVSGEGGRFFRVLLLSADCLPFTVYGACLVENVMNETKLQIDIVSDVV